MSSPLENLAKTDTSIHAEAADAGEYEGLIRSGRVRLADAANQSNSVEGRFDLGYNASHALCLAALRRSGYRSGNRFTVFQTLPHTLGLGPDVWRVLAKCHTIRNHGEYEGVLDVDERIVTDLVSATISVLAALDALGPLE